MAHLHPWHDHLAVELSVPGLSTQAGGAEGSRAGDVPGGCVALSTTLLDHFQQQRRPGRSLVVRLQNWLVGGHPAWRVHGGGQRGAGAGRGRWWQ